MSKLSKFRPYSVFKLLVTCCWSTVHCVARSVSTLSSDRILSSPPPSFACNSGKVVPNLNQPTNQLCFNLLSYWVIGDRSGERCLLSAVCCLLSAVCCLLCLPMQSIVSSRETYIITYSVVIGTTGDKTVMIIEIICIIFMTYICVLKFTTNNLQQKHFKINNNTA